MALHGARSYGSPSPRLLEYDVLWECYRMLTMSKARLRHEMKTRFQLFCHLYHTSFTTFVLMKRFGWSFFSPKRRRSATAMASPLRSLPPVPSSERFHHRPHVARGAPREVSPKRLELDDSDDDKLDYWKSDWHETDEQKLRLKDALKFYKNLQTQDVLSFMWPYHRWRETFGWFWGMTGQYAWLDVLMSWTQQPCRLSLSLFSFASSLQ